MPTPSPRSDKQEPHALAIKLLAHHVQARVIGFAGTAELVAGAAFCGRRFSGLLR
jgi:hypothetical protein